MAPINRGNHLRFVDIVRAIFIHLDFQIERISGIEDRGVDLIARRGEDRVIIEVKAYRSSGVSFTSLRNAALQLRHLQNRFGKSSALLAVNIAIKPEFQQRLLLEFGIAIYGQLELMALTASNPHLQFEFENLLREMFTFDVSSGASDTAPATQSDDSSQEADLDDDLFNLNLDNDLAVPQDASDGEQPKVGVSLCERLRRIDPGRERASDFEKACEEALIYLFGDHLVGWSRQTPTNTGLHIFDLIARISSANSFWVTLSQQFRTRNPVFEFKNYKEPITQAQIYTTEKYLYPAALRGTAIIISREGCTENADEARRGALREAGKLIVVLSLNDICFMLHAKDSGDEPSDLLAERLDEMLFHLDR